MKSKFLLAFLIIGNFSNIISQNFVIKPIESLNLSQEKILFEKFAQDFFGIDASNVMFNQVLQEAFQAEEKDYLDHVPEVLFFHALLDGKVIGYVSCQLLDDYHVHIRQLVVDPEVFTTDIVKELLLMVFKKSLKAKSITISCLVCFQEMIDFLKAVGFLKLEPILKPFLQFCSMYELKVNSKCKICELLYPNIWTSELDEDVESKESREEDLED
jgi:N-acetylglutamate synthase-like GNAT family acetyltransferase